MISGQLGTAQLGMAQLGSYEILAGVSGGGDVTRGIIDASNLNYVILPDFFKLLGYTTEGDCS